VRMTLVPVKINLPTGIPQKKIFLNHSHEDQDSGLCPGRFENRLPVLRSSRIWFRLLLSGIFILRYRVVTRLCRDPFVSFQEISAIAFKKFSFRNVLSDRRGMVSIYAVLDCRMNPNTIKNRLI
jgi:hypothetical protein